ncbi:MAG: aminotransferase class IV [Actinomycetia bacterium]|nr:aminotransferase class IV [Actinomycetes bacterium]
MALSVFIEGRYISPKEAQVSVFDAGFIYSDVVYDVTSVWKGWFFKLDEHLDRFEVSCKGFRLSNPYDQDAMKRILARCVKAGNWDDAYIKVECTRGVIPNRSRDLREAENTFMGYALPYIWIWGEETCRNGANLHVAQTVRRVPDTSIDARYKNYNRGDFTKGKFEAYDHGCDDVIMIGTSGEVTEGSGYNVLVVKDGTVATADSNVLEGVTRQAVLELCSDLGIPYELRRVEEHELADADEVIATTTAGGVMPVIALSGKPVGDGKPGSLTVKLQEEYWDRRARGWHGTKVDDLLAGSAG